MYERRMVATIVSRLREPRRRLQVIAGPRQTGKTFAIGQALRKLDCPFDYCLAEGLGINPQMWLESTWNAARVKAKASPCGHILAIDEIQKIRDWSSIVKRLWDEDSFSGCPLKVVLLGSSRLLLERGLAESLAGRFEITEAGHWSFPEMRDAFGCTLEEYILFGGYPGTADLRGDEARWRAYVVDSIADPSVSQDILQLERIAKPALLRQLFSLACSYSGRIMSYQKLLGQLQDAGNATTLAHYLHLLDEAGLVCGLEKYCGDMLRTKASSPKLVVRNTALSTALSPFSAIDLRSRGDLWGHAVESAAGAHLLACAKDSGVDIMYWNSGSKEVDFVIRKGDSVAALEVKSAMAANVSGMKEFSVRYPGAKTYLIGGQGMPLETFFATELSDFL